MKYGTNQYMLASKEDCIARLAFASVAGTDFIFSWHAYENGSQLFHGQVSD